MEMTLNPFTAMKETIAQIPDDPNTGTGWRIHHDQETELPTAKSVLAFAMIGLKPIHSQRKTGSSRGEWGNSSVTAQMPLLRALPAPESEQEPSEAEIEAARLRLQG